MKNKFLNAFVIALILFQAVAPIGALAYVSTNHADYAPGSVVTISGDNRDVSESNPGFAPGETVHVDVTGPNGYSAACAADANNNGAWFCQVTLTADAPDGNYSYVATGLTSRTSQSGSFTVTAPPPPTVEPTQEPTTEPTVEPTTQPTTEPTVEPTVEPSATPTTEPTVAPTVTATATAAPVLPPFIQSDKDDYYMGETVILTSGNWQPGESVHLIINDDIGDTWRLADDVLADANGAFTYQFQLPDWIIATYRVYAYGPVSGVATMTFTDSPRIASVTVGSQSGTLTYDVPLADGAVSPEEVLEPAASR